MFEPPGHVSSEHKLPPKYITTHNGTSSFRINGNNNNRYNNKVKPIRDRLGDSNSNNRQRPYDPNCRNINSKRWNNRKPYYNRPNRDFDNSRQQTTSIQHRIDDIRNTSIDFTDDIRNTSIDFADDIQIQTKQEIIEEPELDATDITVQVVNSNCTRNESETVSKFKMVLDPVMQAAIRNIQSKIKEKQVVFPLPVKPNVTSITMHDRFTML